MTAHMRRRRTAVGSDRAGAGGFDLCELSRHKGAWERVVAHLEAPAVRLLGQTCRTMYESILYLPWSRFVGDDGQAVYAPILRHEDQNAYADHCHGLLLKLQKLFDKRGRLRKKKQGYTIDCRDMRRQQSVHADDLIVAVHQTMHCFNLAQVNRKVRPPPAATWKSFCTQRAHTQCVLLTSLCLSAPRWKS